MVKIPSIEKLQKQSEKYVNDNFVLPEYINNRFSILEKKIFELRKNTTLNNIQNTPLEIAMMEYQCIYAEISILKKELYQKVLFEKNKSRDAKILWSSRLCV